jgi:hypothetical protein
MRLGQAEEFVPGAEQIAEQSDAEQQSLYDRTVANFMAKLKAFYDNFGAMKLQAGFVRDHPELQSEYSGLMERGGFIDTQIQRAKSAIASVQSGWDWFKTVIGLGDLGVLPLMPIAIAAAAGVVALIASWLTDVYVFSRKVEAIKALEAKGAITGRQAAESILEAGPTGLLDVLQKNIIWVIVGGALLFFGPEIIKMIKARR